MNTVSDDIFYVEPPTIKPGMTISEYQRQRPPVKRVWVAAMVGTCVAALRGVQFYKHNPNG